VYQKVNIWLAIIIVLWAAPSYIMGIISFFSVMHILNIYFGGNYSSMQNYGNGVSGAYPSIYSMFSTYSIIAVLISLVVLILGIILLKQWMDVLNGNILDVQRMFEKISVDDIHIQSEIKAAHSDFEDEVIPSWAFTVFVVSLVLTMIIPFIFLVIPLFSGNVSTAIKSMFFVYLSSAILALISFVFFLIYLTQVISSSNGIYKVKLHIYSYLKNIGIFQSSANSSPIQKRNIFLVILLVIITGGIYWFYLIIKLSLEINRHIKSDSEIWVNFNPSGNYEFKSQNAENKVSQETVSGQSVEDFSHKAEEINKTNLASDVSDGFTSTVQEPAVDISKEVKNIGKDTQVKKNANFFDGFTSIVERIKINPFILVPVGSVLVITLTLNLILQSVTSRFGFVNVMVLSFVFYVFEWALTLLATLITILMIQGRELKSVSKEIFNFFVFAIFISFFLAIGFWINLIVGIVILFLVLYIPGLFSNLRESNFYDGFKQTLFFTFSNGGRETLYTLIIAIGSGLLTLVPYAGIYLAFFVCISWVSNTYIFELEKGENSINSGI